MFNMLRDPDSILKDLEQECTNISQNF
jgi:hypothetical protein